MGFGKGDYFDLTGHCVVLDIQPTILEGCIEDNGKLLQTRREVYAFSLFSLDHNRKCSTTLSEGGARKRFGLVSV